MNENPDSMVRAGLAARVPVGVASHEEDVCDSACCRDAAASAASPLKTGGDDVGSSTNIG